MAAKSYDTAFLRKTALMLSEVSGQMNGKTSKLYQSVSQESMDHLYGEYASAITERGEELKNACDIMAETLEKAQQLLKEYAARLDAVDKQMSEMFSAN